jgi:hypothetical protein
MAHWRAQVLLERDPWKRFLWSFIALEVLTHKLYEHVRDDIVGRLGLRTETGQIEHAFPIEEMLWKPDRAPVASKFAMVADALFPDSAVDDATTFRDLKKARDRLSHGASRNEAEVPASQAFELLQKYVTGAVEKLVLT